MTMMLGEVLGAGIASAATSAKKLVHIALLALYQIKLPNVKVNAGHDAVRNRSDLHRPCKSDQFRPYVVASNSAISV